MYGTISCSSSQNIGNDLVKNLAKKVETLKIGPGMDKKSEMGPLVTKEHLSKVNYVDLGSRGC